MVKVKERVIKTARGKKLCAKEKAQCYQQIFQQKPCRSKRSGRTPSKLKGKNFQTRTLYPARLPFRIEGDIKSFPDKQKLEEFITTRPILQEILKGVL